MLENLNKYKLLIIIVFLGLFAAAYFLFFLGAVNVADASKIEFQINTGESFSSIVADLKGKNLIRSQLAFKILSIIEGKAANFKPGDYELNRNLSGWKIMDILTSGNTKEVEVTIPEGSDLAEIDEILSDNQIIGKGTLISYQKSLVEAGGRSLEGYLFPDTYKFFIGSSVKSVVKKFTDDFNQKALPLLGPDQVGAYTNLIIASLVEKEANDDPSRALIAGIIKKRIENHMPLQLDATICYIKEQVLNIPYRDCSPITSAQLKIVSPYNTYLNPGLPPTPISNPGISAITAVINSKSSPYWYYLSDPKTGAIIFAKDYQEQQKNEAAYLGRYL